MIKLDLNPDGWTFPGTTTWNDGRGDQIITLTSYDFIAPDFSVQRLEHDLVIYESLVIKAGAVTLTQDVDYKVGFISELETKYVTAIAGIPQTIANGIKIVNATYQGVTLTATGKYGGDADTMRRINDRESRLEALEGITKEKTTAGDSTLDLTTGYSIGDRIFAKNRASSGIYFLKVTSTLSIPLGISHSLKLWLESDGWHWDLGSEIMKIQSGDGISNDSKLLIFKANGVFEFAYYRKTLIPADTRITVTYGYDFVSRPPIFSFAGGTGTSTGGDDAQIQAGTSDDSFTGTSFPLCVNAVSGTSGRAYARIIGLWTTEQIRG